MEQLLLVGRLIVADLRRRPVQAIAFLLTVGIAATALAVGLSVAEVTDTRYAHTRSVTAGPDVVAQAEDDSAASLAALEDLAAAPEVTLHSGPHRLLYTSLTARGQQARALVEGRAATPDVLDRPSVTSGSWLSDGGAVVERSFAEALGVRTGDRITVADREFPVAGIAVTAAHGVYPWAEETGPAGGPNDYSGLVWLTEADARAVSTPRLTPTYAVHLRLADPDGAPAFARSLDDESVRLHLRAWQDIASMTATVFRGTTPVLLVGAWLLALSAVTGAAVLAAVRAAEQTRRVGLLKAVGATPGLVTAVLLAEYLALGLVAAGVGLAACRFATPALAGPIAGLLDVEPALTPGIVLPVLVLALLVALSATAAPSVRAARTATLSALSGAARPVEHVAGLTALAGRLPVPWLLGLRLVARRPGRAVLGATGIATAGIALGAGLWLWAQPRKGYDLGGVTLANLRVDQTDRTVLAITAALLVLAVVNTAVVTWATALDARRSLAVARAFGATPGQVTAALAVAQLPAAVGGAVLGLPLGGALHAVVSLGPVAASPPDWWLPSAGAGMVLLVALIATVPAVLDARRAVTPVLRHA